MKPTLNPITIIFALPWLVLISATALYYLGWSPGSTVNRGELMASQTPLTLPINSDKWSLWLVDPHCAAPCLSKMEPLQRLRQAMGKHQHNVELHHHRSPLDSNLGESGIYLVDPRQFLVTRYPMDVDLAQLKADLKRLIN